MQISEILAVCPRMKTFRQRRSALMWRLMTSAYLLFLEPGKGRGWKGDGRRILDALRRRRLQSGRGQTEQTEKPFFTFLLGYDDLLLLVSVLLALVGLRDCEEFLLPSPLLGRLGEEILKEVQGVEQSLRVQVDVQGGEGHLTRGEKA